MADHKTVCARAAAVETALWENTLGPQERAELETHARECAECRAVLDGVAAAREGVAAMRDEEIPVPPAESAWAAVKPRLTGESWAGRQLRKAGWLKLAAGLVLVVGAAVLVARGTLRESREMLLASTSESEQMTMPATGEVPAGPVPTTAMVPSASPAAEGSGTIQYSTEAGKREEGVTWADADRFYRRGTNEVAVALHNEAGTAVAADNEPARVERGATMALRVPDARAAFKNVTGMVAECGGRVLSSTVSQPNPSTGAQAQLRVRIPVARFDGFIVDLRGLGEIVTENLTAEDRTDAYADLEGRLKDKEAAIGAARAALARPGLTAAEVRRLEAELARLRQEQESLAGQKRTLADRTDYAVVNLTLTSASGVRPAGGFIFDGFIDALSSSMATALELTGWGVSVILVGTGALAPWVAVALVVWWFVRRRRMAW